MNGRTTLGVFFKSEGTSYCTRCRKRVYVITTGEKKGHSSSKSERGRLIQEWTDILLKCPDCGGIGKTYKDGIAERDGTYHSNEERRACKL